MSGGADRPGVCVLCTARQGAAPGTFNVVPVAECVLCRGLFDQISVMARKASNRVRRHDFRTFSVGVSLPQGVQESEDELRATFKLMGRETVKTQVARLLGAEISARVGRPVDRLRPQLTILADFASGEASASSKPLFYYGRYTKPRGLLQKRSFCLECSGRGCPSCGGSGYGKKASVEGHLRRRLEKVTGTGKMTFTWIGTEDASSRVYPPGRPFVVELKNPVMRKIPSGFLARYRGGSVRVTRGRLLPARPVRIPSFRLRTVMICDGGSKVTKEGIRTLAKAFRRATVKFDRPHNRPVEKRVSDLKGRKSGRKLIVEATLEGGLPVKRFISGESVTPSVSEVLKTEVRCRSFDIREVRETSRFTYAEITRL